jgi:signal transduction histidine kinase
MTMTRVDGTDLNALRPRPEVVSLVNWFIPAGTAHSRTELDLARTFVFTHLFGPAIAQPMTVYLYFVSPGLDFPLIVMGLAMASFWLLPLVLRWTGDLKLVALLSFQMLSATSLFGAFHYGGFSSPFLPWLIVSMLLGFFYLSKSTKLVMSLFVFNIAVFLLFVASKGVPDKVPIESLSTLGWLSIGSATIYMTWMALYYARIIGLRSEFEAEIERQHATSLELHRARATAEENEEARSRFFAKMSHELRTPLNAIIGYSDLLLEDSQAQGGRQAGRTRDITRINAAGRHLLSLVADVLDVDKLDTHAATLDISEFSLGSLCDDVVATALPMVEGNRNRFDVVCRDREYRLRTDATKLRQILLNLLSNAGKFTKDGVVRLEFHLERRTVDDQLLAIVSDTGIGISAEALSRLFKDYEQSDVSTFSRFGGTGIGLALSRKLSILLSGDIQASSRTGHGSTFSVVLPAHLQTESEAGLHQGEEQAAVRKDYGRTPVDFMSNKDLVTQLPDRAKPSNGQVTR